MALPAYLTANISPQTEYLKLPGRFQLESGDALDEIVIAYRTWGSRANAGGRAVLVCHALTGSADVDSWWPGIIGAGKAFDPAHDFIVCANIVGSCYGSTGPASIKPGSAVRYRADFPDISVRDMVVAERMLLDHLGVEALDVVTGPSLGGMQAMEWAAMYPSRVAAVVPIGVGAQHSPWCIGISEAQRAALAADPNWRDGYYSDDALPAQGLAAARMMAVCSYRSWHSFADRFGRERAEDGRYQVQSYLRYQGEKINTRFDANSYVTLTHAMHTHDLARGRGELTEVLAGITQPSLVVSVSSDALYPPQEQAFLAEHMPNARYRVLDSAHGHDGFLIETDALSEMIKRFRLALGETAIRKPTSATALPLQP